MRLSRSLARAGFSLIEVNMAIFVLAGGALALLGLFPVGLRDSLAASQEMRVAAFADRFVGAAKIAAVEATDVNDLKSLIADYMDTSPGFQWNEDAGERPSTSSNGDLESHKDDSGVYYRAWAIEETDVSNFFDDKKIVTLGILVTGENADQNKRALLSAANYGLRVILDPAANGAAN